MTTLVLGATGETGRLLVEQLLSRGESVRVIVRDAQKLPQSLHHRDRLSIIQASVLALSDTELARHVKGCDAVASCLGHNLSFKGIFGPPRRLVTDATRQICESIRTNGAATPTKFVLMNTAGNSNRDLREPVSFGHKLVVTLLRWLVPPHADNEEAADYLRVQIGQSDLAIAWVAVRPDDLVNEAQVTAYEIHQSPTRSAIFDAGSTSRINVAHFMAELITCEPAWRQWQGNMPVIYNKA